MEPRTANEKTYKSRKRYWQNIDAYTKLFMDTCKRLPKEADYAQYKLIPTVEDGERRRRRQRNDASSSAETRRETANDDEAEQYEQCHAVSGESSSRNSNTDDDSASSMNVSVPHENETYESEDNDDYDDISQISNNSNSEANVRYCGNYNSNTFVNGNDSESARP
ncbi:uncharacterized protein [Venturia canescens]|uniref:uncharacterized protein isoform X1 n=1 Tax=Venturia canescens TaxID=32260 RepID=UPI001C9BE44F|nr:uncharacterized protein LOC122407913 isoform X1 [Venturia canescens]